MQLNYTISVISKCTHLILVERSDHDQTWLDYIHILRVTEQIIKIKLIINLKCRCIIVNQFLINTSFFFCATADRLKVYRCVIRHQTNTVQDWIRHDTRKGN